MSRSVFQPQALPPTPHRRRGRLGAVALAAVAVAITVSAACNPVPPPACPTVAAAGPVVSPGATEHEGGDAFSGTRVWYFVPDTLKNGTSAPVVVLLHGFELLAPEIYGRMIDHLTAQGYVVVFPQYNKGGLYGILTDTDQNQMLSRAVASTNVALDRIGARADRSKVFLFGHSLGGLMGPAWEARGGVPLAGMVLANPSLSTGAGIPDFARPLVNITPIPIASLAGQVDEPVMILTGDADTIAPPAESLQLHGMLTGAPCSSVFQATTDTHGSPDLVADHMATIQDSGVIPDAFMAAFGGDAETDALDLRYYWAALDQMLVGGTVPTFDLGRWSDGTPVAAPTRLR